MATASKPDIRVGRSAVFTKGGIVCSVSPLAASAGIGVLRDGGNAFDAAVATAAVEGVTNPAGCGLGGEVFVLAYHARSGGLFGLTSSGKAPGAATRDWFVSRGYDKMPRDGPLSVAIPGEVEAYVQILERFGSRPLASLLEPAIGYAENGYPIPPKQSRGFASTNRKLNSFPDTKAIFTKNGAPFEAGDVLVNKNLAKTLRRVAQGGADEFYRGDTGREIVRSLQAAGGIYSFEEFSQHEAEWYEPPISTTYRGHAVYETNPPSQGLVLLEMLNILEDFDLAGMGFYTAEAVHVMVEAKKLAFADRNAYMGDPAFIAAPTEELISKEHAARRRAQLSLHRATADVEAGMVASLVPGDDNTSYFCVVDAEGNALSFIHSLSAGYGSGFVAGNTGVLLNNRAGRGFSLEAGHPNVIEPGKRTMHTLNAYMVFKNGEPFLVGGTPGGDRQIVWNAQVITNVIDYGMDPQEAVEAPRWVSWPGTDPDHVAEPFIVELDLGMAPEDVEKLRALGHDVQLKPGGPTGGAAQLIMIDQATGVRKAGSDPRTDGHAAAI